MELNLTCQQRSFCHQDIGKIEVLNGAVSQLEFQVYSNQVLLISSQFRDQLTENLERKKPIARDSLTEYINQKALKIENSTTTKYGTSGQVGQKQIVVINRFFASLFCALFSIVLPLHIQTFL